MWQQRVPRCAVCGGVAGAGAATIALAISVAGLATVTGCRTSGGAVEVENSRRAREAAPIDAPSPPAPGTAAAAPPEADVRDGGPPNLVAPTFLWVRTATPIHLARRDGAIVGLALPGAFVKVIETDQEWARVVLTGPQFEEEPNLWLLSAALSAEASDPAPAAVAPQGFRRIAVKLS